MEHDLIAKAEKRYLSDSEFRSEVEEIVTIMMNGIWKRPVDTPILQQERLIIRMTACVTLLRQKMKEEEE